jgi:hypothetical protein
VQNLALLASLVLGCETKILENLTDAKIKKQIEYNQDNNCFTNVIPPPKTEIKSKST